MGAFDKIKSGLPGMDELLNYIRMGDNVVWSVADLEDFKFFAIPFAEQAIRDGRNLIYMRFADHEPLLTPRPGLKICEFDPDKGFEAFTVDIHDRITEEGKDAFYVFDSLSSLQSVWYTDLMMGNFFRVTCPYLFQLDTVAYFPLLRGRHSFEAVARIRDILLMTPGRVGTSSPELGVPVSFAQISGFCGICEVSDNRAGYMPELSYGSHMFQDLVEAGIFYCALWGDERTVQYNEAFFGDLENLFPVICPERKELAKMVRVSNPEDLWYWNNEQTGETVCGILHERIG